MTTNHHEMTHDFALALCATKSFICVIERTNKTPFDAKIATSVGISLTELYNMIDRGDWERGLAFWNYRHRNQKPRGYDVYKRRGGLRKPENIGKDQNKETLHQSQQGRCYGCMVPLHLRKLTIDHIVQRALGGTWEIENLQRLCQPCNALKGTGTHARLISLLVEQGVLSA